MTVEKENWQAEKARLHRRVLKGQQGHPLGEPVDTGRFWRTIQGVLALVDYLERENRKQEIALKQLTRRVEALENRP